MPFLLVIARVFSEHLTPFFRFMSKRKGDTIDTRQRYARLAKLGKASFVSQSGLANVLKEVKAHGLPESFSRATQHRAREDLCDTITPYGPLVTHKKIQIGNEELIIGFQNPFSFVHYHCENSPHFALIVSDALRRYPCTAARPWDVVIYQDGVDPSDGLAKNKSRKSAVYYWSFKQFGYEALAHEQVWGTVAVMRTTKANKLEGGMPRLTYHVLEQFFGEEHDIRRSGMSVQLHGSQERAKIIAKIGILFGDIPALAEMLSNKGHGGTRPCPKCLNATHHKPPAGAAPLHLFSDWAVPITETNFQMFQQYTNKQIKMAVQQIDLYKAEWANGARTKLDFETKETLYGWSYNAWSIILAPKFMLDAADAIMFDWAHVYVAGGIADVEFGVFMKHMSKHKSRGGHGSADCTYQNLYEYLQLWKWPKSRGNPLHLLGTTKDHLRYLRNGDFPCSASEFMTLAPVLRRYLSRVTLRSGNQLAHVESMIAALETLELLMSVNRDAVSPETLHASIHKHVVLFKAAYTDDAMRPKHHYAMHLPCMLRKHGMLLATFTQERKHRAVKRYTRGRDALQSFELNVLKDITAHAVWELELPFYRAFSTSEPRGKQKLLLQELFKNQTDLTIHNEITINGGGCSPGDCVSFRKDGRIQVGELLLTVGVASRNVAGAVGKMYCYISEWDLIQTAASRPETDSTIRTYQVQDHTVQIDEGDLLTVFVHSFSADRMSCTVLLPYECRALARPSMQTMPE